mmetsp:Transcript_89515/g.261635  ORF Transcript_89515/g.261635 Transcript_89515/m.261635 type:complete len:282 (-) Transcript_89515:151-996(-)
MNGMRSMIAPGEYCAIPGISMPGGATTPLAKYRARGDSDCQRSKGMLGRSNQPSEGSPPGAKYSTFGSTRARSARLGVPPCQQRLSLKMAEPARSGQSVLTFIHEGSSDRVKGGSCQRCEPGTFRMGPFIAVTSSSTKFTVTTGGTGRSCTWPSCGPQIASICNDWYSIAPASTTSPPAPASWYVLDPKMACSTGVVVGRSMRAQYSGMCRLDFVAEASPKLYRCGSLPAPPPKLPSGSASKIRPRIRAVALRSAATCPALRTSSTTTKPSRRNARAARAA